MLFTVDPTNNQLVKTKQVQDDYIRTSYQRIYASNKQDPRIFLLEKVGVSSYNELFLIIKSGDYSQFINKDKAIAYLFELYKEDIEKYLQDTYSIKATTDTMGQHPIGSVMVLKQVVKGVTTEYLSYSLLHPKDRWNNRTAIKSVVGKLVSQLDISDKSQYKEAILAAYLTN